MSDNPTNGTPAGSNPAASGTPADEIPIEVETGPADSGNEASTEAASGEAASGEAASGEVVSIGDAGPGGNITTGAEIGEIAAVADHEIAVEVDTRESEITARLGQLEAEKAELEKEKKDTWERLLRATADLENYRKRARRDVDDARIDARTKVLRPMLEVIDNLERAVEHAERVDNPEQAHIAVLEGVKLVLRQFSQVLERFEVRVVEAVGQPFDPNLHEAISQIESAEHPSGSVVSSPQKGYTIGERLLRPSLVVVAKAPPAPANDAPAEPSGEGASDDGSADGSLDGSGGAETGPEPSGDSAADGVSAEKGEG